ncbi:MAG: DNA internalization-related competence protein ComEC/Rec2 [Desulfuromonadales bacterium]|nr:DNA internalization-related competence protein ComEC/Rec2 [Desulfuromonadales bacterium]MBN2792158.1 DNA internalization-related competence protein ComEC/Rec2 [Desulfuromonadales bacterium]
MQLILLALTATISGLGLSPFLGPAGHFAWGVLVFCCVSLVICPKPSRFVLLLLFVIIFTAAHLRYQDLFLPRDDLVKVANNTHKMTVVGTVLAVRQLAGERTQIDLDIESLRDKTRHFDFKQDARLRLYLELGTNLFHPGDVLCFESRVRQPRLFGTPGEFNWPRYLAGQGIELTGWVQSADQIERLEQNRRHSGRIMNLWRQAVAAAIVQHLPQLPGELTRALILGEGKILSSAIRKTLSSAGISHLFAISGLHLGMIGLLCYRLLFHIYCRSQKLLEWQPPQKVLPLVIIPVLLVYLFFTGDAVATRRAFALFTLGAVFLVWRYYVNPLMLLASLAFLSLLINPLLLWQASWQLSFCGAAGILLARPLWQTRAILARPGYIRYCAQLFLVTAAAMLTTLPLVVKHFHLLAPAGILTNLICVPIVTLVALPVGLLGLLLFPLLPSAALPLFSFCGVILEQLLKLAEWFVAIPPLEGQTLFLSLSQHLALACFVAVLLMVLQPYFKGKRFLTLLVATCLAIGAWKIPVSPVESVSLTMFSVGQGESLLLQNRAGQAVLIDGGGLYSPRFDVGERLLAPAFGALNIRKLDAVVLTHDHPDHRKGLLYILANFPVDAFYSGHDCADLHPSLQEVLGERDISYRRVQWGWQLMPFWENGDLLIHSPMRPGVSENDASLAMYLQVGAGEGLLLTGDLEREGVRDLISDTIPGPVSLLKLPHHGSRHSLTDTLVERLRPQACLVSVGYQNRYKLPASEVLDDLRSRDIALYRTDQAGTLRAQFRADGWEIRQWQRGLFR